MIDPANALFEDARGMHLLVALSGGADSVALLVMLHECAPDVRLTCAHVEHGIRGRESLDDAAFCENLCRRMNVSLHIVSIDVPAESARTGEGLETAARRLRHEALERIRISVNADRIALAHHLNDQAETVLMHLLRGSGVKGACGMPRDDGRLYRPLLGFSRKRAGSVSRRAGTQMAHGFDKSRFEHAAERASAECDSGFGGILSERAARAFAVCRMRAGRKPIYGARSRSLSERPFAKRRLRHSNDAARSCGRSDSSARD